jgi:hypothetical protein
MRVRLLVVLLAFVAMAAIPSEAMLADDVGSVVGQVASCVEPSGLMRDGAGRTAATECADLLASPPVPALVAIVPVVALALVGLALGARTRRAAARGQAWRLGDAVVRCGVPWRAPPAVI